MLGPVSLSRVAFALPRGHQQHPGATRGRFGAEGAVFSMHSQREQELQRARANVEEFNSMQSHEFEGRDKRSGPVPGPLCHQEHSCARLSHAPAQNGSGFRKMAQNGSVFRKMLNSKLNGAQEYFSHIIPKSRMFPFFLRFTLLKNQSSDRSIQKMQ